MYCIWIIEKLQAIMELKRITFYELASITRGDSFEGIDYSHFTFQD